MRLWLLTQNKWSYDCTQGFVVRAENEEQARRWAASDAGMEGEGLWLDPGQSRCVPLHLEGEPGIILKDYWSS